MVSGTPVEPAAEPESATPPSEAAPAGDEVGAASDASGAPDTAEELEPADEIAALIQRSVDDALARWEVVFGEAGADLDADDVDFDAQEHLTAAAMGAAQKYLADHGIGSSGSVLKVDTGLLTEHGAPLVAAVFAAVDASLVEVFRDLHDGRKPKAPPTDGALELDFSDLFDGPRGRSGQGGPR